MIAKSRSVSDRRIYRKINQMREYEDVDDIFTGKIPFDEIPMKMKHDILRQIANAFKFRDDQVRDAVFKVIFDVSYDSLRQS